MPQPRKARASKPATPASKRASAAGPPSLYVSFCSGASAMYSSICLRTHRHGRLEAGGVRCRFNEIGARGQDEHVRGDAVARHPVFALLNRLVEAELLLLRDRVEHDLVVHRRTDVSLRAKILGAVVLRKGGHSVISMGKDRKGGAVFEWARLTLKS